MTAIKSYFNNILLIIGSTLVPLLFSLNFYSEHLLHLLIALPFIVVSFFIYFKPAAINVFGVKLLVSLVLLALLFSHLNPLTLEHVDHLAQSNSGVHICCVMPTLISSPEIVFSEVDQIIVSKVIEVPAIQIMAVNYQDQNKSPPPVLI